jgi:hypothetical protein
MSQIFKPEAASPPPPGFVETLTGNSGGAVGPDASDNINTIAAVVAAGTTPFTVVGNPGTNTLTWDLQISQAVAATNAANNGISHFNSADFTVDANGFVSLKGAAVVETFVVDAATAPGTNPVVPNASGQVTITGGQVAAGTTTNVIQTNSLAANTYTVQIQRSQAVAASTVGDNGVSHFNSAQFTVDANAFVSITNFSPFNYTQINHASSPYTVTATDYYISADPTAGVISVLLPNAPTLYRRFVIKDRTGQASVNNISVTTVGGSVTIDGQTTYTIAGNFGSIQLLFNGTSYEVW